MALTYTLAGTYITQSGGTNGATVDVWKASRFSVVPVQNAAPPSGVADAGPVTTSANFGSPGSWQIACPTNEQYYARIQYLGSTYWSRVTPVISADGASGYQIVQDDGGQVFNVMSPRFGATGNGVTDDSAAINAAVAAAGAGIVYFPAPGTYVYTGGMAPAASCTVAGGGRGSILFLKSAANLPVVQPITNNVTIQQLVIDGNGTNNVSPGGAGNEGVYANGCDTLQIIDCEIRNCNGGPASLISCTNSKIVRPYTHGNGGGPEINGGSYNKIIEPDVIGDAYGIYIHNGAVGCDVIEPNVQTLTGSNTALGQAGGVSLSGCSSCIVYGGISEGSASVRGYYLLAASSCAILGARSQNCGASTGAAGFDVDSCIDTIIDDCYASANGGSGFIFSSSSGNMNGVCTNNRSYNNGRFGSGNALDGITLNGANNTSGHTVAMFVDHNVCYDNQSSKTQKYGLHEWQAAASVMQNIIGINQLTSNATAPTLVVAGADVTPYAAVLGNTVNLGTSATTTVMTTPSLPVGTYRVKADIAVHYSAGGQGSFAVTTGTASGTFLSPQSAENGASGLNNSFHVETLVRITAPGTLVLNYFNSDGANAGTAEPTDYAQSLPATGYLIERLQ